MQCCSSKSNCPKDNSHVPQVSEQLCVWGFLKTFKAPTGLVLGLTSGRIDRGFRSWKDFRALSLASQQRPEPLYSGHLTAPELLGVLSSKSLQREERSSVQMLPSTSGAAEIKIQLQREASFKVQGKPETLARGVAGYSLVLISCAQVALNKKRHSNFH